MVFAWKINAKRFLKLAHSAKRIQFLAHNPKRLKTPNKEIGILNNGYRSPFYSIFNSNTS